MIRQLIYVVVGCVATLTLVAGLAGVAASANDQPNCPTESDCRPVYADGRWTIVVDAN